MVWSFVYLALRRLLELLVRCWRSTDTKEVEILVLRQQVQSLIVRLATENPRWGYQRIRGEPPRLGCQVSATDSSWGRRPRSLPVVTSTATPHPRWRWRVSPPSGLTPHPMPGRG